METIARVLAVGDGRAQLACEVHSSCRSCGSGRGCGLRLLARGREPVLEVPDRSDSDALLVPGQVVTVAIRDADVLRSASLVYLPVLCGLLGGALLGGWLGVRSDGVVALGGALGATAGWALARGRARRSQPRVSIQARAGDAGT